MADALDLHLNIENGLSKTLDKSDRQMRSFNSKLDDSAQNFERMTDSSRTLVDKYNDVETSQKNITKYSGQWKQTLGRVGGIITRIFPMFAGVFSAATIAETWKETLNLNHEMMNLSFRMGEAGETTEHLTEAVRATVREVGIATEEAGKLVSALREMRVPAENIQELTTTTAQFMEITGATADSVTQLTAKLTTFGNLGVDQVQGVQRSIVEAQRQFGLAQNEVEALNETLISTTSVLANLGKTAEEIEDFSAGTAQLAGAFSEVGIEAQKALSFIDELLDPGKVEENAFLYSQLGISLQEAFAGDVDPGRLVGEFQQLGQTIGNMARPAAAAMAEQLGFSVRELEQMQNLDVDQLEKMEKALGEGKSHSEAMAIAMGEQESPQRQLEKAMNRLTGALGEILDRAMPRIEQFAEFFSKHIVGVIDSVIENAPAIGAALIGAGILFFGFIRRKMFAMKTQFASTITEGVSEGIRMGAEKGQHLAHEKVKEAGASITQRTESNNKAIQESLRLRQQEYDLSRQGLQTQEEQLRTRREELLNRTRQIEQAGMEQELAYEKGKILKELRDIEDQSERITRRQNREQLRFDEKRDNRIRAMGDVELSNLIEQRKQTLELTKQEEQRTREQRDAAAAQEQILHQQMHFMQRRGELGPVQEQQIRQQIEEQRRIYQDQNNTLEQIRQRRAGEIQQLREVTSVIHDQGRNIQEVQARADAIFKSPFRKGMDYLTSAWNKGLTSIRDRLGPIRDRFTEMGHTLRENLRPRQVLGNLRKGVGSLVERAKGGATSGMKGMASGMKGMMKFLGPVGIIMGLLRRMEPVQEFMSESMERIQPLLNRLGEALLPLLDTLMEAAMPLLEMAIDIVGGLLEGIVAGLTPILDLVLNKALVPLIEFFMPPLLTVLGGLLGIIGYLIQAIGDAIGVLSSRVGDPIAEAGKDLRNAGADMIRGLSDPVAEGTEEGVRSSEEDQVEFTPADLRASGEGIHVERGIGVSTSAEEEAAANTESLVDGQQEQTDELNTISERIAKLIEVEEKNHEEDMETQESSSLKDSSSPWADGFSGR